MAIHTLGAKKGFVSFLSKDLHILGLIFPFEFLESNLLGKICFSVSLMELRKANMTMMNFQIFHLKKFTGVCKILYLSTINPNALSIVRLI